MKEGYALLDIGDTIQLELKKSEKEEKFKSKVLDKKENQIYIDYPISEKTGKIGIFLEGTEFKVSFVAKDSAIYMFDTEVQGRKKENNIPMIIISYPGKDKMVRIQRREFVRVETAVDVAIHPMNGEFLPFTTVTADISAGGAAIILPENHILKPQMKVKGWFVLPLSNGEYYYINNTICKIIRVISDGKGRDKAPVQFIDMNESDRQAILRLCFDRQIATRKRGL